MTSRVNQLPVLYVLGSIVLIVACLYWAKPVLMPLALSVLITFLLNPVVNALYSRGLPRIPAVLVVVVLAFSVVGGVGYVVTRQLSALAYELPYYQKNLKEKISDLRELGKSGVIERVLTTIKEVTEEEQRAPQSFTEPQFGARLRKAPDEEPEKPVPVVVQAPSVLWRLPTLLESLATAGLVIVLVIFMLIRYAELRGRLLYLAGQHRLTTATKAIDEAGHRISRYLLMQSIINGSYGAAAGLGFFLLGVPYAILWGFLAAVLRFIPYLGPPVAALLPSALSLAVFPGWIQPFLVIGLILILELASNMIMEPLLYGQSAGVSEVALLVAIAFWTWLWGAVGLVLATPLTVCIGVLGKYIPQLAFLGVLLGDEPVMAFTTNYYQRLVAQDEDEAAALVEEYLETHSVDELYDEVLIPALSAGKRDRELGTMTDEDMRYIIQATRRIMEDLNLRQQQRSDANLQSIVPVGEPSTATPPPLILGCPAHDEAEELALHMLQQVLDPTQHNMTIVSAEMLPGEVLSVVEQQRIQLICIAALPPGALAPVRYLCKRLRARFPDCRIMVGLWGGEEENDKSEARIREAGADEVVTTLRQARNQIGQLSLLASSTTSSS